MENHHRDKVCLGVGLKALYYIFAHCSVEYLKEISNTEAFSRLATVIFSKHFLNSLLVNWTCKIFCCLLCRSPCILLSITDEISIPLISAVIILLKRSTNAPSVTVSIFQMLYYFTYPDNSISNELILLRERMVNDDFLDAVVRISFM